MQLVRHTWTLPTRSKTMAKSDWRTAFIEEIGPMIRAEAKERGYKVCSPIVAQATLESFKSSGLSLLASKYHNYFGLKCGSSWRGASVNLGTKEEYTPGTLTSIKANFRAYASMREGVKGYFNFINTKRYANLKTATTPRQYLEYIKADGYATDSQYVESNMKRIQLYNLTTFDYDQHPINCPYSFPIGTLKRGQKGEGVMWLQYMLNRVGFCLTIDGAFGPKTEEAVKAFQTERGLIVDGIAGKNTKNELLKY